MALSSCLQKRWLSRQRTTTTRWPPSITSIVTKQKPLTRRPSMTVASAMKLYSSTVSRGKIVEWYLKELGVNTIETVLIDMQKKEQKEEFYLKINPFGKVPALEDGDLKLFESGAILQYVAEKFSQEADTPEKRATIAKWLFYANTELVNAIFNEKLRDQQAPVVLGPLDKLLGTRDYLEGNFTVADVAVGATLAWQPLLHPDADFSLYPNIESYKKKLYERPAFSEVMQPAIDTMKGWLDAQRQQKN